MRLPLTAVLAFASTVAIAAADVITVPMQGHVNHDLKSPDALTSRYLQKRDLISMPLTNIVGDIVYSLELGLGTPVQTFRVMIDTGSPITWVIGTSCTGSQCASIVDHFNPVASTSSNDLGSPFSVSYVDGSSLSGEFYGENYTLGTLKFDGVIGVGSDYDTSSLPPGVDGLLGLWFTTFWQDIFSLESSKVPFLNILGDPTNTVLTDKVIGIWLEHQDFPNGIPANTSAGGEITFGGVNPARYTGNITYIDCVGAVLGVPWSIPVGGITVGGQSIDVGVDAVATIDTGTSLMLVSEEISDAINSAIPGAKKDPTFGAWFLPCSGTTITALTFGTFTAQIPYTHMAVQQYSETNLTTTGAKYCLSAAMYPSGNVSSISNWLVGDLFLKNVYSVFDFGTRADSGGRIGFAQLSTADFSVSGDSGNGTSGGSDNGTSGSHSSASSLLSMSLSVGAARVLIGIAAAAAFIL